MIDIMTLPDWFDAEYKKYMAVKPEGACSCKFCATYDLYRWATISQCRCACHGTDSPSGHDGLCCEFPNGYKGDSPYDQLRDVKDYRTVLDLLNEEAERDMIEFSMKYKD
jgi:hypothetical protein